MSNWLNMSDDEIKVITDVKEDLFVVKRNNTLIEIPDNATNGEIYEKIFGYADEETKTVWNFVEDDYKSLRKNMFSKTWWNAPYKKGENNGNT